MVVRESREEKKKNGGATRNFCACLSDGRGGGGEGKKTKTSPFKNFEVAQGKEGEARVHRPQDFGGEKGGVSSSFALSRWKTGRREKEGGGGGALSTYCSFARKRGTKKGRGKKRGKGLVFHTAGHTGERKKKGTVPESRVLHMTREKGKKNLAEHLMRRKKKGKGEGSREHIFAYG